jgi:hypothetical protein
MLKALLVFGVILVSSHGFANSTQDRPPQYVIISYDGSLSIPMWEATRALATSANAEFTYFISGVYFVNSANKQLYKGPRRPSGGSSAIGFGGVTADIKTRISEVDTAIQEGNAISSHANGHFGGGKGGEDWTLPEWTLEFDAFHWILSEVFENNKIPLFEKFTKQYWVNLLGTQLRGFRAPQLSINDNMYKTLAANKYTYDSSKTSAPGYWPEKNAYGTWNMPLGYIPIVGTNKSCIAMDYNFYMYDSKAKPDPANADKYQKQMYLSYLNYFTKNYNGNRAPVIIGHHFSTWNGGAYWKALTAFTKKICAQPEVICATFDQYEKYVEGLTPEQIQNYKQAKFDTSDRPVLPAEITHPQGVPAIPLMSLMEVENKDVSVGCSAESHNEDVDVDLLTIDE